MTNRHRDRIVDREVMKLQLREAKRRIAERDGPRTEPHARSRSVLVAVEVHDDAAAAAAVAAAGLLAAALGAEVIVTGVGDRQATTGPATVDAARQEQVDLVVVSLRGGADHDVVVPIEPSADAAA